MPTDNRVHLLRTDEKGSVPTFCGMSPDGGMVGCDIDFTTVRGPAGANQIILDSSGLHFAQFAEPTFTRYRAWTSPGSANGSRTDPPLRDDSQAPMVCRIVDDNGSVVTDTFW